MSPVSSSGSEKASSNPVKKPWIVIVGPTAVGKSGVAEALAEALQSEIVVADSRQIYQEMDIATGKPGLASRRRVPRHLIDLIRPDQLFSAGAYQKEAKTMIVRMEQDGKQILIEGGTGLYVKTLLYGLWAGPSADWNYRNHLANEEKERGDGTLHRLLSKVDPEAGHMIHPRDLPKIIRALEVHHLTGRPLSEVHKEDRAQRQMETSHFVIGLRRDRNNLYRRIEARIATMLSDGLIEETERLLASGLSPSLPSMRGLGYRQIISYLIGERSFDEAVSILKRDTRRYAKRQMTWFRADPNVRWLDLDEEEAASETAARIIRNFFC